MSSTDIQIYPIGAESLGTRSFCFLIKINKQIILVDPSVSLGPRRFGLPPHALELAASYITRLSILKIAEIADIIITSHYHADHYTLNFPRIYEFTDNRIHKKIYRPGPIYYSKAMSNLNYSQRQRAKILWKRKEELTLLEADGNTYHHDDFSIVFSPPLNHGDGHPAKVVGFALKTEKKSVIYTSDVMGGADEVLTEFILKFCPNPDYLILDGPGIYLSSINEKVISKTIDKLRDFNSMESTNLIVDHHLLRMLDWRDWWKENVSSDKIPNSFASFIGADEQLLEARRKELFDTLDYPGIIQKLKTQPSETKSYLLELGRQLPAYNQIWEPILTNKQFMTS